MAMDMSRDDRSMRCRTGKSAPPLPDVATSPPKPADNEPNANDDDDDDDADDTEVEDGGLD